MPKVIIQGITEAGKKFRPSDWAERLCCAVASYDNQGRIHYHRSVSLATIKGVKCVVIAANLEKENEMLFDFLIDFANENQLQIKSENNFYQ